MRLNIQSFPIHKFMLFFSHNQQILFLKWLGIMLFTRFHDTTLLPTKIYLGYAKKTNIIIWNRNEPSTWILLNLIWNVLPANSSWWEDWWNSISLCIDNLKLAHKRFGQISLFLPEIYFDISMGIKMGYPNTLRV